MSEANALFPLDTGSYAVIAALQKGDTSYDGFMEAVLYAGKELSYAQLTPAIDARDRELSELAQKALQQDIDEAGINAKVVANNIAPGDSSKSWYGSPIPAAPYPQIYFEFEPRAAAA